MAVTSLAGTAGKVNILYVEDALPVTDASGESKWDLEKGRKAFLGRHNGMPDRNFWWYTIREGARTDSDPNTRARMAAMLKDPKYLELWEWVPVHSNCPELNLEVVALIDKAPLNWRPFLRSVFVGRMLDGDLNAEAKQAQGSAWVGLSFQFTAAIGAYVAAFDRFRYQFARKAAGDDIDAEDIAEVFRHVDTARKYWANTRQFAGSHPLMMTGPSGRDEAFYDSFSTHAEMFAVSHEFAHHLLGHTNKAALDLDVASQFDAILRSAAMYDVVHSRPTSHTKELMADLVGLQLAALPRGGRPTEEAYAAMAGSIATLLAEADVHDHWFLNDLEGHPSTVDRITLMLAVFEHMIFVPSVGAKDSVAGLAAQLAAFASVCMQNSLNSKDPVSFPAASWEQARTALQSGRLALLTGSGAETPSGFVPVSSGS